jgi:hypothetical protein
MATISAPTLSAAEIQASQYSRPLRLCPCCTITTGDPGAWFAGR